MGHKLSRITSLMLLPTETYSLQMYYAKKCWETQRKDKEITKYASPISIPSEYGK